MNLFSILPVIVLVFAFLFNFSNGFNDAGNQVATVISSRALSPYLALAVAALGNFIGAYFLGTKVAATLGKGLIVSSAIPDAASAMAVLATALLAALLCNSVSWHWSLSASSSHALIGGLLGSAWAAYGKSGIDWHTFRNIILAMLLAPLIGFFLTFVGTKLIFFLSQNLTPKAQPAFRSAQTLLLLVQSLAFGTNDAQKTMGLITFVLFLQRGLIPGPAQLLQVPDWVVLSCSLAMTLGLCFGAHRAVKMLGHRLYRVRAVHSLASQISSSLIVHLASSLGFPLSSTQVISSSVMGAGAAFRFKSVRWTVVGETARAWLITIPLASALAWAMQSGWRWVSAHVAV